VDPSALARFEETVLPHLDAAYTLARYLLRNDDDAEDVVQDAYLRAVRHFGGYREGMRRPSIGAVWVPSSRVTVQNLELGPFDELQQGGLRLAHRERGRTEEGAWDWHCLL
jgi:hypothetical protein